MDQNINVTGTASFDATNAINGAKSLLREFRNLRDFAKNLGTLSVTAKLSGNIKADLRAALTDAGNREFVIKAKLAPGALDAIKRDLNSIASVNLSTLNATQAQITTQLTQLRSLIAELRALGGGTRGGSGGGTGPTNTGGVSANTNRLLQELEQLNNAYKRGSIGVVDYESKLRAVQVALRASASTATAGTKEFRALDTALTRTATGLQRLDSAKISQLRAELVNASAAFNSASAAATTTAQRTAALGAHQAEVQRITVALRGLASSGQLSAQQLAQVNTLLAQSAQRAASLGGATSGLTGFGAAAGSAFQNISGMIPGVAGVTSVLGPMNAALSATVVVLGSLSAALIASFKSAATFQQAMQDIKALTTPTAEQFGKLRDAAINLGQDLGVGASESAAAMLELSKAGLSAQDVIGGGLTGALNLSAAAAISTGDAAKFAVTAMTTFGLTAQDLPRIADVFANFSNGTVLGAQDLGQALQTVGSIAKDAGLDLDDLAGTMATLAQGGMLSMQDAGTSLKSMLMKLRAPTDQASALIKQFGLDIYDAEGNVRPLVNIVAQLQEKFGSLTKEQRDPVLNEIFGSDGIKVALTLMDQGNQKLAQNIALSGKAGTAAQIAKDRLETYKGEVLKMQAAWEAFRIEVGDKFLPVATEVVKKLGELSTSASETFNDVGNALAYVPELVKQLSALGGVLGIAGNPQLWGVLAKSVSDTLKILGPATKGFEALIAVMRELGGLAEGATYLRDVQAEAAKGGVAAAQAYKAQGTALGDLQARAALAAAAVQRLTLAGDQPGADQARGKLRALQDEIRSLRALTAASRVGTLESLASPADVALTKEQTEALKDQKKAVEGLQDALKSRRLEIRLAGLEGAAREIEQVRQSYAKLREDAAKPFGGNQKAGALAGQMAELARLEAQEVARIRADAAKEARKKSEEEAKQNADLAATSRRAAVQAEIDAMTEGAAKTRAIREREAQDIRDGYAQQVRDAKGNQQLIAQYLVTARAQIVALQARWAREDQQTARDNALKVVEAQLSADLRLSQRQVQVAQGAFAQLEAQRSLEATLARQAQQYALIVQDADRIGLTEEQRAEYARKVEDSQFAVEDSVRAQAELTKQILTDAQTLSDSYTKLSNTLRDGGVPASEQLAESSKAVGQAFREAAPFIERFRAGTLKPGEIEASQKAFDKLSTSLERQQEALSAMTAEYDRQRSALDSLFGTLRQFGSDLGNEELLTRALGIDQQNLKASTAALRELVASGKATAQQLSDGAQQVKSDYDALKATYEDLGNLKAAPLLAQADEAAARGQQALEAELRDSAQLIKDEYTKTLETVTNDIAPLMRDVGTAGLKAADDVAELGKQVKIAEQQVKESSQKMRESFTGVFTGLADQAGKAGTDAGKRFVDSLGAQLKSARIPALSVGSVPASKAAGGAGGNVYNISISGRSVNGSPVTGEEAALLDRLATLAEARCRRRGS